jgi:peptidoglycan hydrolase-like protein with peptidoglycan-binding domain
MPSRHRGTTARPPLDRRKGAVKQSRGKFAVSSGNGPGGQALEFHDVMTDPAEKGALPPFRLAMAAGTAALCAAIVYNAVVGQDGRQRDVLSRLSDLEQHETLPVTIGLGAFDGRPTTRSAVTIEQLAALAAKEGMQEALATDLQRELAALGFYQDQVDGQYGPRLRQAIEAYQRAHDLEVTGEPTARLLDHIRFMGQVGDAASPADPAQLDVRAVQEGLARLGYAPGPQDGVLGPRTADAIREFERDRQLKETGTLTDALAQEISRVLSGGG